MADATSLMSPSPGLSATRFSKGCESYSPKGPENVNITTLNRFTGRTFWAATRRNVRKSDLLIL